MLRYASISLIALAAAFAVPATAQVVSCPFTGATGDNSTRGFYVTNYPASTLGTVTLQMTPFSPGPATDTLTARRGTFDGPVLGTATVSINVGASNQMLTFDFGGVAVAPGSTITFAHAVTGSGVPNWDIGSGSCPNVFETQGTTPPLDSIRGSNSYALSITGAPAATSVPTLSQWGLLLLGTLMFALFTFNQLPVRKKS